jgi:hypothetical protein
MTLRCGIPHTVFTSTQPSAVSLGIASRITPPCEQNRVPLAGLWAEAPASDVVVAPVIPNGSNRRTVVAAKSRALFTATCLHPRMRGGGDKRAGHASADWPLVHNKAAVDMPYPASVALSACVDVPMNKSKGAVGCTHDKWKGAHKHASRTISSVCAA